MRAFASVHACEKYISFLPIASAGACDYLRSSVGTSACVERNKGTFAEIHTIGRIDARKANDSNKKKHVDYTTSISFNKNWKKLSCDSLTLLLIKTSSINTGLLVVSNNERIDSIKNSSIYITTYRDNSNGLPNNVGYLMMDTKNKILSIYDMNDDRYNSLRCNIQLLNYILSRKCYGNL